MTFETMKAAVLGGSKAIHRSWPRQGYRCYFFERDGQLWIHHTDGTEHPSGPKFEAANYLGSEGWTTELVD